MPLYEYNRKDTVGHLRFLNSWIVLYLQFTQSFKLSKLCHYQSLKLECKRVTCPLSIFRITVCGTITFSVQSKFAFTTFIQAWRHDGYSDKCYSNNLQHFTRFHRFSRFHKTFVFAPFTRAYYILSYIN